MTQLPLSIALGEYEHTRDVISGSVPIEGVDPRFSVLSIEEITNRFMRFRDLDVCELSFGNYSTLLSMETPPVVALPIFISRVFRHGSFYVRTDSKTRSFKELEGKRIGLPQWSQTATVYARGLLTDSRVDLASINWVQAGLRESGRLETAQFELPPGVNIEPVTDRSITEMLIAGDLDAIISARSPKLEFDGKKVIRTLLDDVPSAENDYWERTQIFPIMHLLVMRRDVYEANRWIARNLLHAFTVAKSRSISRLTDSGVSYIPMAWGARKFTEFSRTMFGNADPWPYGLEANRPTVETFLRYASEQRLLTKTRSPEEIFAAETLLEVRV